MALQTENLLEKTDKVAIAIERLKSIEDVALSMNPEGYYVCISGGKDSSVIQQLCIEAGVKCGFYHNHTGIDHPETVYFLRREKIRMTELGYNFKIQFQRLEGGVQATIFNYTKQSPGAGLPTRVHRWCCRVLKEWGGHSRYCITGIRWSESVKRKTREVHETFGGKKENRIYLNNDNDMKRKLTEICLPKQKVVLNPIIDWTDKDVWEFIESRNLPMNPLYKMGFHRVGCVGCPMAGAVRQKKELEKLPGYKKLWLKTAENSIKYRNEYNVLPDSIGGKNATAQTYFDWWLSDGSAKNNFDFWTDE